MLVYEFMKTLHFYTGFFFFLIALRSVAMPMTSVMTAHVPSLAFYPLVNSPQHPARTRTLAHPHQHRIDTHSTIIIV
jgi:hypothetical protein